MIANIGDAPYNVVLLLHLLSVIVGVGAAFLGPIVGARARSADESTEIVDAVIASVMAPALFAAGVFGGALVGMSDDVFDFQQTWLIIAGPLWIVAVAAATLLAPPNYVSVPPPSGSRKAALAATLHLTITIQLVVMVWQPGI